MTVLVYVLNTGKKNTNQVAVWKTGKRFVLSSAGMFYFMRDTMTDFDWPTRVTRVTLKWYPVYAAHAVPREYSN